MLLIYLESLSDSQQHQLVVWNQHHHVHYWPRSYPNHDTASPDIITDWWMLFDNSGLADIWILRWPEHTRVCRTLFD
jgi:hypothetical protein